MTQQVVKRLPIDRAQTLAKPRAGRLDQFALLMLLGLMGLAWQGPLTAMWHRWFPAWESPAYAHSLMQRLTEGSSYYTHGPMVPLISLLLVFYIHRRVGLPIHRQWLSALVGWVVLVGSLGLHLLGIYAEVAFVSGFALVGSLLGLLLVWGGWPLLRAYWLAAGFLVFMIPLPMSMIADLNLHLKFLAGRGAMWLVNHLLHVPVLMDGSFVYLSTQAGEDPKYLIIEDVCSGLRSLIALICFASLFALVCRVRGKWRWLMLALAGPVAVGCNVVRIAVLTLVAHYWGTQYAGPDSAVHDLSGLAVFALALGALMLVEQMIFLLNRVFKRNWTDLRLLGYLDRIEVPGMAKTRWLWVPLVLVFAGTAVGSFLVVQQDPPAYQGDTAARVVSRTMSLGDRTFTGMDLELDEQTLTILETRDYLYRRFVDHQSRQWVDLAIVFSANNRKSTHPPEVCLTGGGEQVVAKHTMALAIQGVGQMPIRELVTQRGSQMTYHLYVYKCGSAYTPSFIRQQATIFANGLLGRNTAGAQIRLSTAVAGSDVPAARKLALQVAHELLPQVAAGLP